MPPAAPRSLDVLVSRGSGTTTRAEHLVARLSQAGATVAVDEREHTGSR
ncbi:hypothetical protein [Skermania piniformis]|nr:hypothetical protein [Skermania piniformis]